MFWCQQEWKMPTMYITCVCLCVTFAKRGRPWLRRHVHPGFDGLDLSCGWKMLYDQCHLKIVSRYYKLYTQCSFVSRARHFFKSWFNNIARAVEWTRFEIDSKTPKVDTHTMAGKWGEILNGNRQGPLLEAWPHWSRGWLRLVAGLKLVERCRKHLKQQTCFGTPNHHPCDSEVLCSLNSWIV